MKIGLSEDIVIKISSSSMKINQQENSTANKLYKTYFYTTPYD